MAERWEDFRDAYLKSDKVVQAFIRRLLAAYVAVQEGTANAVDVAMIAMANVGLGESKRACSIASNDDD